jgi:hypothetical protein
LARSDNQSFWSTVPGILTGVAAFITAVTGLWIAIGAHNKPDTEQPTPAAVTAPTSSTPAATSAGSPSPAAAQVAPSAPSSVTVTARDGNVTKLEGKTFVHNSTDSAVIQLTSGQTIPFEKMKAIDFLTAHPDQYVVDISITLTDGRTVTGGLKTNYAFKGENDLGPFTIFVQDVKQITFNR